MGNSRTEGVPRLQLERLQMCLLCFAVCSSRDSKYSEAPRLGS
jgi:hypothetical protein